MKLANRRLLVLLGLLLGLPMAIMGAAVHPGMEPGEQAEAFDRIVPGLTRAEDVAGLGLDLQGSEMVPGTDLGRRLPSIAMRAKDCIRAGQFCTGYVLPKAATSGAPPRPRMVLLVRNGRVVDKVLSAELVADGPPQLRVATAF